MELEEAVLYYHSLERFGIRPGLDRIRALCRRLGDPQKQLRFIHVAGTNGKGSTCTEIASVLTAAGYRTGLYTSPYVLEFRERIRINGRMIAPDDLVAVTNAVRQAIAALNAEGISITEFEAVTAAAFLYYKEQKCDIVVLETGLGGRFDATNIIEEPLCSIITSISLDHTKILGDTIEKIAYEKCGIIKTGRPVITSVLQPDAVLATIRNAASSRSCAMIVADPSEFQIIRSGITGTDVVYRNNDLHIPFPGQHQLENASLAISAIEFLKQIGYHITDKQISSGISGAAIPARIETISSSPLIILDGSHNDGSTRALARTLKTYLSGEKLLAVMGMMADKDCEQALRNLLPLFSAVIAVEPSNPRSMPAEAFAALVRSYGTEAKSIPDPVEGVRFALTRLIDFDALIVCGSLYLAADVREYLIKHHP